MYFLICDIAYGVPFVDKIIPAIDQSSHFQSFLIKIGACYLHLNKKDSAKTSLVDSSATNKIS
jgi:hypothetical protein